MLLSKEKWRKIVAYKLLFAIYISRTVIHTDIAIEVLTFLVLVIFHSFSFVGKHFWWKKRHAHRCSMGYTKVNKWISVQAKRLKPLNSWKSERERMCNNCRIKYAIAHKIQSCVCAWSTHCIYSTLEFLCEYAKKCVCAWKESEMAVLLVKYLKYFIFSFFHRDIIYFHKFHYVCAMN